MNNFVQKYLSIVNEAKFKSKKWIKCENIKFLEIYEQKNHLENRIKSRYNIELSTWKRWALIKTQAVNLFLSNKSWELCSNKSPYQRGFTIHLTISNMWLSGQLQNDLDDNVKRIYFSTFLPEQPTFNKHDIFLKLEL